MELLGSGNSGCVYSAKHELTNALVAVKIIWKRDLNPYRLSRVQREVECLRTLDHPFIIKIHQISEDEHNIYMFTEIAERGELYGKIARDGPIKENEARLLFWQIILAVEHMHNRGVVHRDLKAENILIDENGHVKIVDFGFGNFYHHQYLMKTFCGSRPYAAPEIFKGQPYHGPSIDIWSLGVLLFAMTTATLPFEESESYPISERVLDGRFRSPFFMSLELEDLIKRMLNKNPAKRATIHDIKCHPWMIRGNAEKDVTTIIETYNSLTVDERGTKAVKWFLKQKFDWDEDIISQAKTSKSLDAVYGCCSMLAEVYRKTYTQVTLNEIIMKKKEKSNQTTPKLGALRNCDHFQTLDSGTGSSICGASRQSTINCDSIDDYIDYDFGECSDRRIMDEVHPESRSLPSFDMGAQGSKVDFRQAVLEFTSKSSNKNDESFWDQVWWPENVSDIYAMITGDEIRKLRDDAPKNLATLCYKCLEKLQYCRDHPATFNPKKAINCIRLLTRMIPFMLEDAEWRGYFWTPMPQEENNRNYATLLLEILSDLLFCPDFTVSNLTPNSAKIDDLSTIDSCEYIWEAGVGFGNKPPMVAQQYQHRAEILKLLLACFSEVIYAPVNDENRLRWVAQFTSSTNRHVLPIFTSLLNVVCAYDPVGYGLPYNYLLFNDSREPLVEISLQVLIVCLDKESQPKTDESGYLDNYFINYLSRIHREEDFDFMLKGVTRLLSNPLLSSSSYLPNSTKRVNFHQELLVLLWKCCEFNQKFMFYVLKTSDVLEILVPILYHISDARNDSARVGLIHMGVFLILLLSGERNFGVRLNKPYTAKAAINVPPFTGTHADLLIIVFHKLITTGNYRLQSLFDCFLTIIVNVSPYLKSISMVASNKLLHLVEAFSTPWFLFSSPTNHHLVFFLLEVFNNIIQYQFDGNSNLIYTIIRKRHVFYQLSNLPVDAASIAKSLSGRKNKSANRDEMVDQLKSPTSPTSPEIPNSTVPAAITTTAGLAATPAVSSMTGTTGQWENKGTVNDEWVATAEWAEDWKAKLPLQTIMRLLQVLVPQVEKICIDKGLTDESEILTFLQHGTLVGLLPVPHPILIRKYQANAGTNHWFRTYMWGVIYLRNTDPPIWYDTDVKLFEIQRL
ncbi:unnamed protein product [Caenorhabditis bovis]|uniref:Protein kinase domain-containing protein n=1 Tax=Caenorhabditis bovis TaxID=2654633 RepID=A0A8S1E9N7_9PELO|nr:unnamed protein product [Caenorhabditis bovis]